MTISFNEFDAVYQATVTDIWQHWNDEMQTEIAKHCIAWAPGRIDFEAYLRASSIRFYKAYCSLVETDAETMCDVGGFWGVWPVTAKKLGFSVAMTETLRYYGKSFDPLFEQIRGQGVEIYDFDPFDENAGPVGEFDFVTVMAVLEHYPYSLKTFFENVKKLIKKDGRILFEVPNIAYLPRRISLLRGQTPLSPISDIFQSETPFIGHHHEFTIAELQELAKLGGMTIQKEDAYNYTLLNEGNLKRKMLYFLTLPVFNLWPATRECLTVVCSVRD